MATEKETNNSTIVEKTGVNETTVNVTAVKSSIITDLEPSIMGIAIHKITLNEKEGRKFYMLSAMDITTNKPIHMSVSHDMVEKFNLSHIIRPGNYNTEVERPLYLKVSAVYIPNDSNRYGYMRDGLAVEYQTKGSYIFRDIVGDLDAKMIREAEAGTYASNYAAKAKVEEAKIFFRALKNRDYAPNVNDDDDILMMKLIKG